jgi:hypothetical protein
MPHDIDLAHLWNTVEIVAAAKFGGQDRIDIRRFDI